MRWRIFFLALLLPAFATASGEHTISFPDPIDALSVGFATEGDTAQVRVWANGQWSDWLDLAVENEQDPGLLESNLVILPVDSSKVQIRGPQNIALHPLRVSKTPASYRVAAMGDVGGPRILSRKEWGADEDLMINNSANSSSSSVPVSATTGRGTEETSPSTRVTACEDALAKYPEEFRRSRTVTSDARGRTLRWAQEYSPQVRVLVVHHTAIANVGDTRPGVEKMRALYQFHSQNRGWGDIGYHYVIDDQGQIYEGRAGGEKVIGGHVYCHNVGTIGISLMGNFSMEQPTQEQTKSLQWLLQNLAEKYDVDLSRSVIEHGKRVEAIVGHRELVSTDCPGPILFSALDQIRSHVRTGQVFSTVIYPEPAVPPTVPVATPSTPTARSSTSSVAAQRTTGLFAVGATELQVRPGEEHVLSVRYQAGAKPVQRRTMIAKIVRKNGKIQISQERGASFEPVIESLFLPTFLDAGESVTFRVKLKFPATEGTVSFVLGDVNYTADVSGRRVRVRGQQPTYQVYTAPAATYSRNQRLENTTRTSLPPTRAHTVASSSSSSSKPYSTPLVRSPGSAKHLIRIVLSYTPSGSIIVATPGNTAVNGSAAHTVRLNIVQEGDRCSITSERVSSTVLRIDPGEGISTIESWATPRNRFRGVLECRVDNGVMILINELPLEDYMAGLAEEGDTEPYEKQRAFAIAARSYALSYLDPNSRKFPGKPYDGADSPATFQSYGGYVFEEKNPQWVRAVRSTEGMVVVSKGEVLKTPYFSSDDGRTRAPSEISWAKGMDPVIFSSKEDPWCKGLTLNGHGLGMSGCGAGGQAKGGKMAEEILQYYYPGTTLERR